ncbi:type II secretion system protein [Bacillus sp. PAMC26568]|nr:type II secretion system protein [Bacillus sp. PAMC26568]
MMKKDCSKQSGFTLIEVLASIVILTIMFSALSGFFVNSASYSNTFDKKLTAVQLSKSLLESYQKEEFNSIYGRINREDYLDSNKIHAKLGTTQEMIDTSLYNATVSFSHPEDRFKNKLIRIKVTVSAVNDDSSTTAELQGYLRK